MKKIVGMSHYLEENKNCTSLFLDLDSASNESQSFL